MGARLRDFAWGSTALGPPERWPQSLKTAVQLMLANRFPMFVWWGPTFVNLYNDAYVPVLGRRHPDALGRPARETWEDVWGTVGPQADAAFRDGESSWNDRALLVMERNGYAEETWFTFSYSPVLDDSGAVGGIVCVCTEETERVLGERRLRTLRELAAASVDATSVDEARGLLLATLARAGYDLPFALLFLERPDGSLELAGHADGTSGAGGADGAPAWAARFAGAVRTAGGAPALLRGLPDDLPRGPWPEPPPVAVALALGGEVRGTLVLGASARRELDASYRGFFELVASGVSNALDKARAYEVERRRAEALAEIDRAKTVFFSNISHEFRTPLTLMLGPLEEALARAGPAAAADVRGSLELAHRNGLRLLKLVNALLDFSRIEAGRVRARFAPTDLAAHTAEVASVFRSAVESAGLELAVDCPPLGAAAYVDRDMWEKVVLNLLSNAFKYTLEGSIRVELREERGEAVLAVSDSGVGIPEAERERVFERFHRVHGTRGRTQEGTGIGLSLVQELVRLHGGSISVASEVDAGSTFTVRLPLGRAHLAPESVVPEHEAPAAPRGPSPFLEEALGWLSDAPAPGDGSGATAPRAEGRVVLADDNADMRGYVRRLLEAEGYEVEACADGRAALEAVRRARPDLVLADVMMPVMDGFALLASIRFDAELADTAVMLLSARAGEEATVEGLEHGADDYVAKPFSAAELRARVRASVEISRLRRRAGDRERALRLEVEAQHQRLQAVLAGIRDHFVVFDAGWRLAFVSDSWCARAGLAPGEVLGRTVWDLFPALLDTPWEAAARRVMETRVPESLEYQHRQNGVWWSVRLAPAADGGVTQLAVDVTAGKHAEEELRRTVDELRAAEAERRSLLESERHARSESERANRLKEEFVATLSHELRTPLTAILGWSQMLGREPDLRPHVRQGLEVIERNARAQTRLVSDLLDHERILAGKLRLEVERVDLLGPVEAAIESVLPSAQAKGLTVEREVDPEVGAAAVDPARIQQVVSNLLSNAIKFTPRGGRIRVGLERAGESVEVSVSDTGEGIAPEFLPHVFDRFRQADASTTRRSGGLGLGLAIVKQLVDLHGGTVRAASGGRGLGSTFTVSLPAPAGAAARAGPREAAVTDGGRSLAGIAVLVVDDEEDTRGFVARALEEHGARVAVAAGAEDAVRRLESERPHVVISDIGMPGVDGYELVRRVRALGPERGGNVPAVALTAFARAEDRMRALRAGFQAHVAKPVDASELVVVVGNLSRLVAREGEGAELARDASARP